MTGSALQMSAVRQNTLKRRCAAGTVAPLRQYLEDEQMAQKPVHQMSDEELSVLHDMCPRCDGELDTGWECNKCGFDAWPIALVIGRDQMEKLH